MDFRNTHRVLVFAKALRKFNRTLQHALSERDIQILSLIFFMCRTADYNYATLWSIEKTLVKISIDSHYAYIQQRVMKLVKYGYVRKELKNAVRNSHRLYVTLEGINLIKSFEKVLRMERWNY